MEWQKSTPEQPRMPPTEFRYEIDPNAHCSVRVGFTYASIHIYEPLPEPFNQHDDLRKLAIRLIKRTRAVVAAIEASLEPSEQVGFPSEIKPVAGVEW